MKLNLNKHDFSILWDGVYYKALSDYPNISKWEIKTIIDFINYEKKHNRTVEIESDNQLLATHLREALIHPEKYSDILKPSFISECTACKQKGCLTDYLCHIAPLEHVKSIFKSGKLMSSMKVNNRPVDELIGESRNAANDPSDFFDYIMFSWGNCQAGDRLVMERKYDRAPTEEDLSINFTPGIRFYFRYNDLMKHPNAANDGYHALKIKDELLISDYITAIIIPKTYKDELGDVIPKSMLEKVHYLENDCKDIWHWSEKVYDYIKSIDYIK